VQRGAAACQLEHFLGSPVGQPGPPRVGVEVGRSGLAGRCGGDIGQEQRAFPPLVQQTGSRRAVLVSQLGSASLPDHYRAAPEGIEVGDVEGEDFLGSRGALIGG